MDKTSILNALKKYFKFKNDYDFAEFLGVKQNTLSSWKNRNTFDFDIIISKCDTLEAVLILTDKLEFLNTDKTPFKNGLNTNEVELLKIIIETQKETIKAQSIALLSKETEMNERALIVDAVRKKLIDNFHLSSSISFEQNYIREIKDQEQELKK